MVLSDNFRIGDFSTIHGTNKVATTNVTDVIPNISSIECAIRCRSANPTCQGFNFRNEHKGIGSCELLTLQTGPYDIKYETGSLYYKRLDHSMYTGAVLCICLAINV